MLKYQQLKMPPGYTAEDIRQKLAKQLHIRSDALFDLRIVRESLDARKKPEIFFVLSVAFSCKDEQRVLQRNRQNDRLSTYTPKKVVFPVVNNTDAYTRPVIVGAGPAGMFCAYYLARAGLSPILLERGKPVEERIKDVERFWETGALLPDSNVQFGEGGAGTFSDGKLNTLNKDPEGYLAEVLSLFVRMGADEEILYQQKPHLGTDKLAKIVANLRRAICDFGGEIRFSSRVTALTFRDDKGGRRVAFVTAQHDGTSEVIPADRVVLAIGHSARDTFAMLAESGVQMEAKAFAVGYRVRHPQRLINESQYGTQNADRLPPASYKLTARAENGRSVYSFCMCPGGYVINASSEEGGLCVNGMSYRDRGGGMANSAVIVSVTPEDFDGDDPLAGVAFQREIERRAYAAGKGKIPLQRWSDYKEKRTDTEPFDGMLCGVRGQGAVAGLRGILPAPLEEAFVDGMEQFDRKIPGFAGKDAVLAGIEARTSSPVRIVREKNYQARQIGGLYPCGEGAGYAGGITSAAMDGLRTALAILREVGENVLQEAGESAMQEAGEDAMQEAGGNGRRQVK